MSEKGTLFFGKSKKPTWEEIHEAALQEEPSGNMNIRGEYNPKKIYLFNDIVSIELEDYQKGCVLFRCRKTCINIAPPDIEHWRLFACGG